MSEDVTTYSCRRVLIADPQPIFRHGLVALLSSAHPHWDVLEATTLAKWRFPLNARSIDLLILDARLLGAEFVPGAPAGGRLNPGVDIIAVTESGDSITALGCIAAGAHGTFSRSDSTTRTLATIETIAARRRHIARLQANRHLMAAPPVEMVEKSEIVSLTTRQLDVLRLLAKGQSNKVIARDLGLSVSTVKVHLNTVFRALGARNRVEAVIRARPFEAQTKPLDG